MTVDAAHANVVACACDRVAVALGLVALYDYAKRVGIVAFDSRARILAHDRFLIYNQMFVTRRLNASIGC